MTSARIILRSLRYHARTNLCVVLGLAVATAVITGSLLVGESMHASLLRQATARLGRVDAALVAPHFFRAALAGELTREPAVSARISQASAAILMKGVAKSPETDVAISGVRICGVDSEFAAFFPESSLPALTGLQVVINQALADDLNLKPGDDVLLVLDRPSQLPGQSLFTRRKRQDNLRTLRVQVRAVLPNHGAGGFSLDSSPATPRLAYVARDTLARALRQEGKANAILTKLAPTVREGSVEAKQNAGVPPEMSPGPLVAPRAGRVPSSTNVPPTPADLDQALFSLCQLEDFGLHLVASTAGGYVALETDGILLTPAQLAAAQKSAAELKLSVAPTSVYLASRIAATTNPPRSIHYAIFAALENPPAFKFLAGNGPGPAADAMFLNSWAAEDLGASVGDELEITYLVPQPDGTYREDHLRRKLQAIVDLSGPAADPKLTPALGGLTDAARIEKWDVPFPLDPSKITPRDDQYWDRYHATPKAFVSMDAMRQVWASAGMGQANLDPVTSLRFIPPVGTQLDSIVAPLTASLLKELSPAAAGLTFLPVRQLAQERSAGNTDLGVLLLSMSMFLIAAAAGLSGTLLRLSIARRAAELGLLLACGWKRSAAGRLLLLETLLLASAGALLGLPLGILYCQAMIALLGHSSAGSWQQVDLTLHVDAASLVYGAVSGLAVGLVCAVWGLWTLRKRPVLNLLAGWQGLATRILPSRWPKIALPILTVAAVVPLFLATPGGSFNPAIAFFLTGACLLIAGILATHLVLSVHHHRRGVKLTLLSLAIRSAALNRSRSLLIVGLFACASFILVAVAANYRDAGRMSLDNPASPAGGFNLRVTTSLPLPSDPSTPAGLVNLGFSPADQQLLARTTIVPFLVAPGDDISCLSLTRPGRPRLLGAGQAMIKRGGFTVDAPTDSGPNKWGLLQRSDLPLGKSIPVFGDADSVRWTLNCDLGQTFTLPGPSGAPMNLTFVGLISGSIFGGELVMSAENLRLLYPHLVGPACLLVQCPPQDEAEVANVFRRNLADFGVEVRTTREILSAYLSVQNLYLSLFLMLGGLGLFLGAAGLLAVILRNVLERRRELALMSACGFERTRLVRWLMAEHAGLLLAGLLCGTIAALVAVAPTLAARDTQVPWITLMAMLAGIGLVGVLACAAGARLAIRSDVIVALRQE